MITLITQIIRFTIFSVSGCSVLTSLRGPAVLLLIGSLAACGGGGGGDSTFSPSLVNNPSTPAQPAPVSLSPAEPASPYAGVLVNCVEAEEVVDSCTLSTLPLLGQAMDMPSVDDIMARTVVSHDWMAERFRQLIPLLPDSIRMLFKGVTAVVIAADIRPSFYTTLSGAIYLDPADLWLTNAEKATIDQSEDFRADFGNDLNFVPLWRYVQGNQYAWDLYPLDGTETRSINDIVRPMAALLFHELAHANDLFPPALQGSLDSDLRVVAAAAPVAETLSGVLTNDQPLNSSLLHGLGQVLFDGVTASQAQIDLTPREVGLEFEVDGASDLYAYFSNFEDLAMLFEEVMMKYEFNIDREVAFTDAPAVNPEFCDEYIVRWGYRNRIGHPLVLPRATYAVQRILNQNDVAGYITPLPDPASLTNGLDWCENLAGFLAPANKGEINGLGSLEKQGGQLLRKSDRLPNYR